MNLRGRHELDVELRVHVEAIDSHYVSIFFITLYVYHPLCYFFEIFQ